MKRKQLALLLSVICILMLCFAGCSQTNDIDTGAHEVSAEEDSNVDANEFEGGSGTAEDPWQIATAEQLDAIRNNLDGHYVLAGDIDLSGIGDWEPIGVYEPASEDEPDSPNPELAFTGTFDGAGYTISNMNISKPDDASVGFFCCVAGNSASISNLTMENITVVGYSLVGGVIGYAGFDGTFENVSLVGENTITGGAMTGGLIGGGFCNMTNCDAAAEIVYTEENENSGGGAGVLAGGMEAGLIDNCSATGSITSNVNGGFFGGVLACAFGNPSITNCTADVTITLGENVKMVGGLVGHAGSLDAENPTLIDGCTVNAEITVPESGERIGGIVGGGYYDKEMTDFLTIFKVINCSTSGSINGGHLVGTIAGYAYGNSVVENCTSEMLIDGEQNRSQIGATEDDVPLDQLR